jgi:hypothetical protein
MHARAQLQGKVGELLGQRERWVAELTKLETAEAVAIDLQPKLEAAIAALAALPDGAALRQARGYLVGERERCASYPRQIALARREIEALGSVDANPQKGISDE